MRKTLKDITKWLYNIVKPSRKNKSPYSLMEQMGFNTIMLAGLMVSLISAFFNFFELNDLLLSVITFISFIGFSFLFYLSKVKHYLNIWLTLCFILALMSIIWIASGGLVGSTPYVYILALFLVVIVAKKAEQLKVFFLFLINITILYSLEFTIGDKIIKPYPSEQSYLIDMVFTFTVVFISVFFILRFFKKMYEDERNVVEKQKLIIEQQNTNYLASLRYASNLQQMIISNEEQLQFLFDDYFVLFKPKDIVSGDFYWAKQKGEYGIIVAADCTGHGVPAAFLSILGISLLEETAEQMKEECSAADFLEKLRLKFIVYTQKNHDPSNYIKDSIDLGICIINYSDSTIQYAGANRPLVIIRDKRISSVLNYKEESLTSEAYSIYTIPGTRNTIGQNDPELPFKNHVINFIPGDTFYLFSDGFSDQFDANNKKKYTVAKLKKELLRLHNLPMSTQAEYLEGLHKVWRSETEQTDDILIVGMKV